MACNDLWTDQEKQTAIEMYNDKYSCKEIAIAVSRSLSAVYGVIKREKGVNSLKNKCKILTTTENEKRLDCHRRGLTDADSAKECGMSASGYANWRMSRGLERNYGLYNNGNGKPKPVKKDVVEIPKKILTADDLKYYHHNDNTTRQDNNKIIISCEINGSEKINLLPITGKLNKGLQPPMILNGVIVGCPNMIDKGKLYNAKAIRDHDYRPKLRKVGY